MPRIATSCSVSGSGWQPPGVSKLEIQQKDVEIAVLRRQLEGGGATLSAASKTNSGDSEDKKDATTKQK